MVEGLILLIVAFGAFGAFVVGVALLIMWYRTGQQDEAEQPMIYGNLIQCAHCGRMNPLDSAACLECHTPLNVPPEYRRGAEPIAPRPYIPPMNPAVPAPNPYAPPAREPGMLDGTMRSAPPPPPQRTEPPAQTIATRRPPTPEAPAPQPAPQSAEPAPDAPQPDAWLEGIAGGVQGMRMVIVQPDTLFGRSTSCDFQIPDQKVSRHHFAIRYGQGAFFLQDQGSTGGTLVNGEQVDARKLNDGDRIDLGESTLVFHTR